MDRFKNGVAAIAFVLFASLVFVSHAEAQKLNTKEIRDIVRSLNSRIADFQNRLSYQLESSSAGRRQSDQVMADLRDMQDRVRVFDQAVAMRRDNRDSINDILDSATAVDAYMNANRQYRSLENDWNGIRSQLDRLSAHYGVTASWNDRNYRDTGNSSTVSMADPDSPLTGTFQIDRSRSESIADILSGSRVGTAQRRELEEKLDAPEELAISVAGDRVTLASTKASPVTFTVNGRETIEDVNGRTVRVRSTLRGEKLTVTSLGGATDYTLTFEPLNNGRTLKVTRRITTDYLDETIFADSVYNRTSTVAGLGIRGNSDDTGTYSSNDPNDDPYVNNPRTSYPGTQNPTMNKPRVGDFIVPNGLVVTGTLDTTIDTKTVQNNDRFRMTVQSPDEFHGAVIEGYLSGIDRAGRVLGKSNITFNFERITLADGKEYDFAGSLQRVVDHTGKIIAVSDEGTAQGKDKSRQTMKRGGIAAGIGAIIGAIAGGGSGAAVGAIIGGGIGAGSVAIEGRGDIRLQPGSTISVQSSSPIR